jgi:hypothetical protein
MDYPFKHSSLKLDRAAGHFRSLHQAIGAFVKDKPHELSAEIDREASRYNVYVKVREPPPELSLIAGDYIQNVRAALDHLICQLVRASGQEPGRSNAFPILGEKPTAKNGGLDRWNRQLRGVDVTLRRWIELVQPYQRRHAPRLDPLSVLRDLSNEDKHRVVLRRVTAIPHPERTEPRLDIQGRRDVDAIEEYQLFANRPLEDGDKVLSAAISITGANPHVHLAGELALDVAFGERLIPAAQLGLLFDRADEIVALLSAVCFGWGEGTQPLGARLGPDIYERVEITGHSV